MSSQSSRLNSLKTGTGAVADDEFYTQLEDIQEAIECTRRAGFHWEGKDCICPCDSEASMFLPALREAGARVTASSSDYIAQDFGFYDMVVTNPPFSLFRDFWLQILNTGVDYMILAPLTAVAYRHVFTEIRAGRARAFTGDRHGTHFRFQNGKTAPCTWITSLPVSQHYIANARRPQSMMDTKPVIYEGREYEGISRMPLPYDAKPGQLLMAPISCLSDASGEGWRPIMVAGRCFDKETGRQLFQRILVKKS